MSPERRGMAHVEGIMANAPNRTDDTTKSFGGGATSSSETPVSSADNPQPHADETGNTDTTRPHPSGAQALAGRNPPMSTDANPERRHRDGSASADQEQVPTGRDHPAESEHDHSHQKLAGESAKMARDSRPKP